LLNNIKILQVEDEIITVLFMENELHKIGYEYLTYATTGEDAISMIKQNPPDIILMDIGLPGKIDGIEAASVIKSESDIAIIFITGYEDFNLKKRAEKINPLGYLIKPININVLNSLIETYMNSTDKYPVHQ
jgi:two-component system, response regulator PdtaR